jgi:D-alanine-D-alanine ligase
VSTELQNLKIGVLMGGNAAEREISLKSGGAVLQALQSAGLNAEGFDVIDFESLVSAAQQVDLCFIALHGRWGEDGVVQAILQSLGKPYSGSGVTASAIAMDKLRTKLLWQGAGILTPKFIWVSKNAPFSWKRFHQAGLGFPAIVKPSHEGSSIGMRKVESESELEEAIVYAQNYDNEVVVEQWITGREFTAAILGDETLPLIELKTDHAFYDFDAKYQSDSTQYLCPVSLPEAVQKRIQKEAMHAFQTVGAEGWGRIDVMLDDEMTPYYIELNTVPGMTDHSLVPMAAKHAGIDFETLVQRILDLALNASNAELG